MKTRSYTTTIAAMFLLALGILPWDARAEKKVNFGGTNHFIYDYGTTNGLNPSGTWYVPGQNLRTPVGHYHLNPQKVINQIYGMRSSGQNAYGINVFTSDIGVCEYTSCNDGFADGVWGELLDNSWGSMRPQHRANLKAIVSHALAAGFERLYVRFAPGDAAAWTSWDEYKYQVSWNYIIDARSAILEAVAEAGKTHQLAFPRNLVLFDLGAEWAGYIGGQVSPFMQRLWVDYNISFGSSDTVGFSFAYSPGKFTHQKNLLAQTGVAPKYWAFSIYKTVDQVLPSLYAEMGSLRNQPVIFMETMFNNSTNGAHIAQALAQLEFLNVESIIQWPVINDAVDGHFTNSAIDALSASGTFSNYIGSLANRRMYFTSSNADILGIHDLNCGETLNWPCSVRIKWSAPSAWNKRYGIYINTPTGTALVHCDHTAGASTVNWISLNPSYRFDLYEISGTSCAHPNPNPGAIWLARAESTPF